MNYSFVLKICFILIVVAVVCTFFKRQLREYSLILSMLTGILAVGVALVNGSQLISKVQQICEKLSLNNYHFSEILKILGICTLVQFTSNTLKDADESALSFAVELAGKIFILYVAFPIIIEFINFVTRLLK